MDELTVLIDIVDDILADRGPTPNGILEGARAKLSAQFMEFIPF